MGTATVAEASGSGTREASPRDQWAPRMWQGLDFPAWVGMLRKNRFAVTFYQWHTAAIITVVSLFHSLLKGLERLAYAGRVARTEFPEAPIFIVGHWRTGTTLLHELLALDERHTYPTTYECLEPNHFLLTEGFFRRYVRFLMPDRRPMDNMAAGWDRPQEDEFALCMMGQPSPYLRIAFPNREAPEEYLELDRVPPRVLAGWKRAFVGFLRRVTYCRPKRLVLKSPTHSCRIALLRELFPGARFVHIVRDPRAVVPSTIHLWKSLWSKHGLQIPHFRGIEEYVFAHFERLYARLDEGRALIPEGHYHELRYEDLVRDPIGQMEALYGRLGLGEFDRVRPALEEYFAEAGDYRTNRYDLPPEFRDEIERRCGRVIRQYGYA